MAYMSKPKSKKILIVEDELALARVLSLKITGAGYECDIANDGEKALSMISKGGYGLVLLDLILPGMDGFEILEKTKGNKNRPTIVVLSNLSQESDLKRTKELGAKDFFVKSDVQLVDVVNYIKKLLP